MKDTYGFSGLCRDGGPPPSPISGRASEKLSSGHHWGVSKSKTYIPGEHDLSSYHGYKLPMAPHCTAAGFRGLVVDYILFPFSSNPSAAHYPLCVTNLQGWQWSAGFLEVYGNIHKSRLGF
jgi:hypothetical protein